MRAEEARLAAIAAELQAKESTIMNAEEAAEIKRLQREQEQLLNPVEKQEVKGVTTVPVRKFRVKDIKALYASRPDLCTLEVKTAEINKEIRKEGVISIVIAGLEIYEEFETVARSQK
jgi:hypothetical protein